MSGDYTEDSGPRYLDICRHGRFTLRRTTTLKTWWQDKRVRISTLILFVTVIMPLLVKYPVLDPISMHSGQSVSTEPEVTKDLIFFKRCVGHHESNLFVYIVAAMSAGATSTTITNPLWVIKTRFMVRFHVPSNRFDMK